MQIILCVSFIGGGGGGGGIGKAEYEYLNDLAFRKKSVLEILWLQTENPVQDHNKDMCKE